MRLRAGGSDCSSFGCVEEDSHLAQVISPLYPSGGGARERPLGITEGCLCGLEGWTSPGGGLKPHACCHVAPVALQHSRRFPHAPLLRAGLRVGAPERAALGVQCDLRQPRVGARSVCGGSDLFHSSFRFGCGLLAPLLGHEMARTPYGCKTSSVGLWLSSRCWQSPSNPMETNYEEIAVADESLLKCFVMAFAACWYVYCIPDESHGCTAVPTLQRPLPRR